MLCGLSGIFYFYYIIIYFLVLAAGRVSYDQLIGMGFRLDFYGYVNTYLHKRFSSK